jgi:hypothetical protein
MAEVPTPKGCAASGYSRYPNWVFASGMFLEWSNVARAVYIVLCYHANQQRLAYPSLRRIAMLTGHSRTHISKAIHELWRCGAISVRRIAYRGANCYYVPLDPAKCPQNVDAYLKRKLRHEKFAKRPQNVDATRPQNVDANKTYRTRKEPRPISVTIQNVIQQVPTTQIQTRIQEELLP